MLASAIVSAPMLMLFLLSLSLSICLSWLVSLDSGCLCRRFGQPLLFGVNLWLVVVSFGRSLVVLTNVEANYFASFSHMAPRLPLYAPFAQAITQQLRSSRGRTDARRMRQPAGQRASLRESDFGSIKPELAICETIMITSESTGRSRSHGATSRSLTAEV